MERYRSYFPARKVALISANQSLRGRGEVIIQCLRGFNIHILGHTPQMFLKSLLICLCYASALSDRLGPELPSNHLAAEDTHMSPHRSTDADAYLTSQVHVYRVIEVKLNGKSKPQQSKKHNAP